jgi:hypothetical protein
LGARGGHGAPPHALAGYRNRSGALNPDATDASRAPLAAESRIAEAQLRVARMLDRSTSDTRPQPSDTSRVAAPPDKPMQDCARGRKLPRISPEVRIWAVDVGDLLADEHGARGAARERAGYRIVTTTPPAAQRPEIGAGDPKSRERSCRWSRCAPALWRQRDQQRGRSRPRGLQRLKRPLHGQRRDSARCGVGPGYREPGSLSWPPVQTTRPRAYSWHAEGFLGGAKRGPHAGSCSWRPV